MKVGSYIELIAQSIKWLIKEAQEIFKKENSLLELNAPIKVTGDFHG